MRASCSLLWICVISCASFHPTCASAPFDFLGTCLFPYGYIFNDTKVGGLSGLAYRPDTDRFYAIPDERHDPHFHRIAIDVHNGKLEDGRVTFDQVVRLGESAIGASGQHFDPEGIGWLGDRLAVSTEPHYVRDLSSPLQWVQGRIIEVDEGGEWLDDLTLPHLLTSTGEGGPGNNLGFEGLSVPRPLSSTNTTNTTSGHPQQDSPYRSIWACPESALVQDAVAQGSEASLPQSALAALSHTASGADYKDGDVRTAVRLMEFRQRDDGAGGEWQLNGMWRYDVSAASELKMPSDDRVMLQGVTEVEVLMPPEGEGEGDGRRPIVMVLERAYTRRWKADEDGEEQGRYGIHLYAVMPPLQREGRSIADCWSLLQDCYDVPALTKVHLIDFQTDLADKHGVELDNYEGMALGPVLPDGRRTLVLVNDDNFNPKQIGTQFIALAFSLEDMYEYVESEIKNKAI
ncbi:unnamed protein product [Vitrella brassicaformis CCMP3155]|uniref:Phytase-like domain-containing protein n=2 Tax=Vitrella brassicaformis TaxID=1169539 RepID=A0A0G4F4I7_VITBC|nr:unnamed protein product [Vitrella brassicaformis CCMP3155]|eukprot:CEM06716.1 unnamed protein product [Vitrella brassicaformis CCMP3155]